MGASVRRKEDPRLITGTATYTDDLVLPGMVYVSYLRSPYAHAKIKKINTQKAKALKGVVAIVTGEDLKDAVKPIPCAWQIPNADLKIPEYPPIAVDTVHYTGDIVAAVAAEDKYIAADAVELIEVDYEPLPAIVEMEKAVKSGSPQIHSNVPNNVCFDWKLAGGDVKKAFDEADVVVKQKIINQRLIPNAMEMRGALAQYNFATGELTIWMTSQNPHVHRLLLSMTVGIPEHKLRVVSPEVGGGFGSKIHFYPGEAIVAYLSMKLNRPAKWFEDRRENYVGTIHGRDHVQYVELAAKKDGTITGMKVKAYANMGAYLSTAAPGIPTILFGFILPGTYTIRNVDCEVIGVLTNTTPVDAYRGAGRPEAAFITERLVDILAHKIGMDPAEIRFKNFIQPDAFPYQIATGLTYDSGNYPQALKKAMDMIGYEQLRREQKKLRKEGKLLGIGISTYVEICGLAPSKIARGTGFGLGLWESSTIRVHPTGKNSVFTGANPHGQGEETTFAQLVADELGISTDDVEVVHGDTAIVPFGMGTYGSRTTPVAGGSIVLCTRKVKDKARKIAAHLLEAREEDVVFEKGKFFVKGAASKVKTIQEIALETYTAEHLPPGMEPGLETTTFYDPENFTYPFGAHICAVDIDAESGEVKIRRYVAVDDCGRIINPMIVDGQIHGGVAQGLAQALWEEAVYDENGNLITGSLADYAVPTAIEIPKFELAHTETPSPHNPAGVKGVGETGTIASPQALVNAVVDALSHLGVTHIDMPIKSEKIWKVLKEKGKAE
jgi:carbon-monoxide dehydrogenase large subunit